MPSVRRDQEPAPLSDLPLPKAVPFGSTDLKLGEATMQNAKCSKEERRGGTAGPGAEICL